MAYMPITPDKILYLFGVDEETYMQHYAVPLNMSCEYQEKSSIYEYQTEHQYVYQKVLLSQASYESLVNDMKNDIEKISQGVYLKIQAGDPFIYNGDTYIKTTAKKASEADNTSGIKYVNIDATQTDKIAKQIAKDIVNDKSEVKYDELIRYRDSFKKQLQSLIEVGGIMEGKLMSYANDMKYMSVGR
jgi:hypothetical protein